jgi:ribosome biogenesis GTPase / thiamine phosphate phosphatase
MRGETISQTETQLSASQLIGTVIAVQANFYQVRLEGNKEEGRGKKEEGRGKKEEGDFFVDGEETGLSLSSGILLCTRRTRLKKIGQQVMVGDRVIIEEPDWMGGRGAIAEVFPRKTVLSRPPIANANQILLVFALAEPELEPVALSRFLVKAESTGLNVALCLNKCDLVSDQEQQLWRDRLSLWGYRPIFISVEKNLGLEKENSELYQQLKDQITVLCGPSGVGKSSLINALIPSINLRVGAVSGKLSRGRHTTRHVELFELPMGGLLADTPGFNQPSLECAPEELVHYFWEARSRLDLGLCQFSNCLHRDEPNCIVRGDWERYQHYLEWLEDAIVRADALQQLGNVESSLKLKSKSDGRREYEPKLESKKYRRSSRRLQHQNLQELCQDMEGD